jgi:hypothetical protein
MISNRNKRSHLAVWALALLLLVGLGLPAEASTPSSPPGSNGELAALPLAFSVQYIWNQITGFMYSTFCSRERMIQLTIVGVAIGLFIMLRRMPGKE